MLELARGWQATIDRGPDWLFIRLNCSDASQAATESLASEIWTTMQQHFIYRVVLEMDQVQYLTSALIGQLVQLHKRVHNQGGVLRLCGLNDAGQDSLRISRLDSRFPAYRSREEAVMGFRPLQPR